MNGYEKRTANKRARIVETAQELFFQRGISDVTVEQIARRAQVSRVTIFKYFTDKDGLVKEAVRSWARSLLLGLDAVLAGDRPFDEKLKEVLSFFVQMQDKTVNKEIRGDGELLECVRSVMVEEGLPRIRELVAQGKGGGAIDEALDDRAILLYMSAFRPILSDPEYVRSDRAVQDSLYGMFMAGLFHGRRGGDLR
jgi:AcrR family transcriptional regulator